MCLTSATFYIIFNSVNFSISLIGNEVVILPAKPLSPIVPNYNIFPLPSVPIKIDFSSGITVYSNYHPLHNVNKTEFVPSFGYLDLDTENGVLCSYLSDYPHCHINFKGVVGTDVQLQEVPEFYRDNLYYFVRQEFELLKFDRTHFNKFVDYVDNEIRSLVFDVSEGGEDVKPYINDNWDKLAWQSVCDFYDTFGFDRLRNPMYYDELNNSVIVSGDNEIFRNLPHANEREARLLRGGGAGCGLVSFISANESANDS